MRIFVRVIAGLLVTLGVIWMLQGVGLLPGSFMTGQLKWAGWGALSVVVGIVLLLSGARRARHP